MEINYFKTKDYTDFIDDFQIDNNTHIKLKVSRHNSKNVVIDKVIFSLRYCDFKSSAFKFSIISNPTLFLNITPEQLKEKIISSREKLKKKMNLNGFYHNLNNVNRVMDNVIKWFETFRNTVITKNITDCDNFVPKTYFCSEQYKNDIETDNICERITDYMNQYYQDSIDFEVHTLNDICVSQEIKFYFKVSMRGSFDKHGKYMKLHDNILIAIKHTFSDYFPHYLPIGFNQHIEEYLYINEDDFILKIKEFYEQDEWISYTLNNTKVQDVIKKGFIKVREEYLKILAIAPEEIKRQNIFHTGA